MEILTGLRHGEIAADRWSVVDLKKGINFVNRSLTWLKGGPLLERPKTTNAYRRLKLAPESNAKTLLAGRIFSAGEQESTGNE